MSLQRAARACYMNDQYAEICRNYSCETEEKKQWDQDRKVVYAVIDVSFKESTMNYCKLLFV